MATKTKTKEPSVPVKVTNKSVQSLLSELGATLLADGPHHECRCEIRSESSGRAYIVSHRIGGDWECSCPGWIFRRSCKHLNAMTSGLQKVLKLIKG